jgi:hypothetical protein
VTGGAQVPLLARKWPEVLVVTITVGTLDSSNTLQVITAVGKAGCRLVDTVKSEQAVLLGV